MRQCGIFPIIARRLGPYQCSDGSCGPYTSQALTPATETITKLRLTALLTEAIHLLAILLSQARKIPQKDLRSSKCSLLTLLFSRFAGPAGGRDTLRRLTDKGVRNNFVFISLTKNNFISLLFIGKAVVMILVSPSPLSQQKTVANFLTLGKESLRPFFVGPLITNVGINIPCSL